MIESHHEFYKMWGTHFTVPTYNFMNRLMNFDFVFKVNIPEPNKERLILERDAKGRIIKSKLAL